MTVRRWEGVDCTGMVNKTDSGSLYFPGHMCVVDIKLCCPESTLGLKGPFSQLLRVLPSGIPQLSALSGNFPWLIRNAWSMIMTPSQEKPPSKSGSCGNTKSHPSSQLRRILKHTFSLRVPYGFTGASLGTILWSSVSLYHARFLSFPTNVNPKGILIKFKNSCIQNTFQCLFPRNPPAKRMTGIEKPKINGIKNKLFP